MQVGNKRRIIRVLLVDDEPDLMEICREYLEMSGEVSVLGVESGALALEALQKERFDAIISDYQMPQMNGIQLLREVRARHGGLPFILFTGRGREDVVIQALDGGVDSYLQKGGDPNPQFAELAHRLKQAVERSRAEQALQESEARLRRAEGVARLGHWELVIGEEIMLASAGASVLYGTETSEMDLKTAQAFVLPGYRDTLDMAMKALILMGVPYDVEFKIRRGDDGRIRDIHSWAEFDAEKGRIFGVIQDITEMKCANDMARQNEALCRRSERRYRILFDALPDPTFLIEKETGLIFDVNKAAEREYGYSREELMRMRNTDLSAEPEETSAATQDPGYFYPLRHHKRADASIFPVEITADLVQMDEGSFILCTARLTDRSSAGSPTKST
jgi:PAS domain S-box-containing protein